jgi:hypothetical protein
MMVIRTNGPRLTTRLCFSMDPVKAIHENQLFTVRNRDGFFTTEYLRPKVIILLIVYNRSVVMVKVKRRNKNKLR